MDNPDKLQPDWQDPKYYSPPVPTDREAILAEGVRMGLEAAAAMLAEKIAAVRKGFPTPDPQPTRDP